MLDDTHDPDLRCWVTGAHGEGCDFPIQNLPFGVFRPRTAGAAWRGGVAIGDSIVDLSRVLEQCVLHGPAAEAARLACGPTLNP